MAKDSAYLKKPWLQYYDDGVNKNLMYEEKLLTDFLENSANKFSNKMALNFQGYCISFSELDELVNKFANCLIDFGIKKNDKVAILLPNLIPCVISYYAILKIGAISVMNNPLYSDRELKHQFNDSNAKLLITLDLLCERMIKLRPETNINQIIYTSIGDYLPIIKRILFPIIGKRKKLTTDVKPSKNVFKWKKLLQKQKNSKIDKIKVSFEDTAMFQYTGGTTGVSKGVLLSHKNLSKQVQQVASWFPKFESDEIMLGALPFFHVFGLSTSMNLAIYKGWGNILVPKPQPDQLIETIKKYKPTFAPLVPTMYIGLLEHPKVETTDLTSIKGCFSGSAPLPIEVINEFEKKTGATIVEGFGMTESSPVTHINPFIGNRKIGSIGLPIPDTDSKIVDILDGQKTMPVGETGELLVKGPQVTKGYWKNDKATKETIINNWLYTGDIAKMDKDGYFYILDRKKDMIISGGFNIYPRDIEEIFFENPKVMEACAIGIPHKKRGETVKVYIVLKQGESSSSKEMIEYCKDKLAKYKWPTEIEFKKELPKSTVGKVLKKDLRNN